MLRRRCWRAGVHRTGYKSPHELPVPCAPRWDLRLAKAKLWNEYIDEDDKAAWQIEDERYTSPEFATFIGKPMRAMKPGLQNLNRSQMIVQRRLPNWTVHELHLRRDNPFQQNVMMGKTLYDRNIHGFDVPYPYQLFKQLKKAHRNDRVTKQNKFRVMNLQGSKNPPPGFRPIADEDEDEKK